jgi:hypothetical protein
VAEGETVAVQFRLNAVTARGDSYENSYVRFIEMRKVARSGEYLDALYGSKMLMPAIPRQTWAMTIVKAYRVLQWATDGLAKRMSRIDA